MKLHNDAEVFTALIRNTAEHFELPDTFVEKDYYISLLLKSIQEKFPNIAFKGGTSLSKCHKVISRFSEDIDLAFYDENVEGKPTRGQRKLLKKAVVDAIEETGLIHSNPEDTRSRKEFNKYEIEYEGIDAIENGFMREHLLIETYVFLQPFPCSDEMFCSYIGEYLQQSDEYNHLADQFKLQPFLIKTQSLERTFIDKIFAICDYHETGKIQRNSRHLYDIHKIWTSGKLDKAEMSMLFSDVAAERRKLSEDINPSASIGYEFVTSLEKIIHNGFYEKDYIEITQNLLYRSKEVSYEDALNSLKEIISINVLPKTVS